MTLFNHAARGSRAPAAESYVFPSRAPQTPRAGRARAATGDILGPCHDDRGRRRRANRRAARGDPAPRLPLLRRESVPRSRTPSTTRSSASSASSRTPIPSWSPPTAPPSAWAGALADAFAPVEHRSAMLSLDNALAPDDLREFEARLARALPTAPRSRTCASRRSTASAWPCSTRAAASMRGATRGDGRVGEDITQNLRTIKTHPRHARRSARRRPDPRGARRGLHAPRGLRPAERRARGGGRAGLLQPAQRRRRRGAAEGSRHHRVAAARRLSLPREPRSTASRFASHWETLEALRGERLPVNPRVAAGRATSTA